jgi:hypothetical protein
MTFDYVYTNQEFTNATICDIEDIQNQIQTLNLVSATLHFINGGSGLVQMVFSNELSNNEKTILDAAVAGYTNPVLLNDTACTIKDIKPPGTNGGTFTNNIWTTRQLNIIEGNIAFAALNTNIITLQPGKYTINIKAPACGVRSHQIRLRNITIGEYLLGGNGSSNATSLMTYSEIYGFFEYTVETQLDIQHICERTIANVGLGLSTGFNENEIYTTVFIQKI